MAKQAAKDDTTEIHESRKRVARNQTPRLSEVAPPVVESSTRIADDQGDQDEHWREVLA